MPRILRTPWTSQPQVPVGVDWSNLIAAKLSAVSVPVGGVLKNYSRLKVDDISYPSGTNINLSAGLSGIGAGSVSANTNAYRLHAVTNQTDTAWESIQSAGTWFALVVRYGNTSGNAPIFANCSPNTVPYTAWGITDGSGVGNFVVECSAGNAYRSLSISSALTNNKPLFLVGRYNGSTLEAWINGVKQSGSTACSGTITYPIDSVTRGPAIGNFYNYTSSNRAFIGRIFVAGISPTALSDAEIKSLSSNPWQIFMPANRPLYFDLGAGGAVTGTVSFTEDNDTLAASGKIIHRATASFTEADDTLAATGRLIHYGSAAFTESNDTAAATGSVGTTGVYGDVAFAESDDTLAALGRIIHRGTATITEADDTFAAVGRLIHRGTGAFVEDDDILAASDADPLHGFTQDQLDFLVMYMEANMAIPTASQIAAAIYATAIDGTTTLAESLRLSNAVLGGKVSGAGTGTETFRNLADTKDRLVVTVDSSGNRTALTRDLT